MYKQLFLTKSVKSLGGGGGGASHVKVTGILVEKLELNP